MSEKYLRTALQTISNFIKGKKPKNLPEAEGMLSLIGVIADETIAESEPPIMMARPPVAPKPQL